MIWGRYHGGRRPSSDDSVHSPTVIPPSALEKPRIMKRYHRLRTCSHTSPRRSPTMVALHDTRFVECRWCNDSWTVKTVVTWRSSASKIPARDLHSEYHSNLYSPHHRLRTYWPSVWLREARRQSVRPISLQTCLSIPPPPPLLDRLVGLVVKVKSGRFRVRIPLATGFFRDRVIPVT